MRIRPQVGSAFLSHSGDISLGDLSLVMSTRPSAVHMYSISLNVRQVIQKSSKAAGCRVDTTARIVRFCIRSDQGKTAERRGRKASGLRGVPRTAGLPA